MNIVHVSYAHIPDQREPDVWLDKLSFFTGILDSMALNASVRSIHCISYDGTLMRNGVEYHFLDLHRWQTFIPIRLHACIKKLQPEVVIVHGLIFPLQVLLLRLSIGRSVKIVVQHHAERPLVTLRKYAQLMADRFIHHYLFCSFDLARDWIKQGLIKDEKKVSEVMEVSSSFYQIDKQIARARTKVEGEPVFVWVGGLLTTKDPYFAIKAFARFSRVQPTARLYMIYQSDELIQGVRALIRETCFSDCISLVGRVEHEQIIYWFNSADFIISTSRYEGSGTAVCEAMSCGCIPLLSDIPSFRMMTGNGSVGMLYAMGNEDSLVEVLQRSISLDRGSEANKVVAQFKTVLSFDAIANKILEVIDDIK